MAFDCSLRTTVEDPRRIFVRAPSSWAVKADLSIDSKRKIVRFLYDDEKVMEKFGCDPLRGKVEDLDGYLWLEVMPDGALQHRGPDFGPPLIKKVSVGMDPSPPPPPPPAPKRYTGLSRGVTVREPKALLEWLGQQRGQLMIPVLLKAGPSVSTRGAKLGSLDVQCEGLGPRVQELCPKALRCALWLRGTWRGGANNVFQVDEVSEIVTGDEPLNMSEFVWVPN